MAADAERAPRIRDGMRASLPLAPSPVLFGLSFGVLAEAEGFGGVAAVVMSATTFAGAAQFAAVVALGGGGTVAAAVHADRAPARRRLGGLPRGAPPMSDA